MSYFKKPVLKSFVTSPGIRMRNSSSSLSASSSIPSSLHANTTFSMSSVATFSNDNPNSKTSPLTTFSILLLYENDRGDRCRSSAFCFLFYLARNLFQVFFVFRKCIEDIRRYLVFRFVIALWLFPICHSYPPYIVLPRVSCFSPPSNVNLLYSHTSS